MVCQEKLYSSFSSLPFFSMPLARQVNLSYRTMLLASERGRLSVGSDGLWLHGQFCSWPLV